MKSLDLADRHGYPRYVAHQVCHSLVGRDYEWDLAPLGRAEGVSALVWSPLGWGRLTGRIRRGRPIPDAPGCTPPAPSDPRWTTSGCTGWSTCSTTSPARPAGPSRGSRQEGFARLNPPLFAPLG